jgi:transcription elongation factor GreA
MNPDPYFCTPKGLLEIRARLREIKERDRPENVADIEEARAHGDLSENAEYHAAKDRQGMLDAEMRSLADKNSRAQAIDPTTLSGDKVVFGATVTVLQGDSDDEITYQIVGETEANIKNGTISYKSPLARALIGKEEGDEATFNAPGGTRRYEIVEVQFL